LWHEEWLIKVEKLGELAAKLKEQNKAENLVVSGQVFPSSRFLGYPASKCLI